MNFDRILWDLDDDPQGNVLHIAQNGLNIEEVEEVLEAATSIVASESSGLPMVFGPTSTGRFIAVVFEIVEYLPMAIRPITAFDVDP